jgi:hypothetical protein
MNIDSDIKYPPLNLLDQIYTDLDITKAQLIEKNSSASYHKIILVDLLLKTKTRDVKSVETITQYKT